jgi:uncharacterized protein
LTLFVDTSALYALLDADDRYHDRAAELWVSLRSAQEDRVATYHVAVEASALMQSRLGLAAVRTLHEDFLPLVRLVDVTPHEYAEAVGTLLAADRRRLSLVDCMSFVVMRRLGVDRAFAFDGDFRTQGFTTL